MVTIEHEGIKVNVPQSWDDITLGLYEQIYGDKPESARDRVALVAKVCNIDADTLLSWPAEVFNIIVGHILFIYGDNPEPPTPSCEIDGTTYVVPIEDELSLGAYVDADEAQKAKVATLSTLLAIVCRPAGEAYDYKNNDARQKMFAAQPMTKVLGVLAFFLFNKQTLDRLTLVYGNLRQAADQLPRSIEVLRSLGGGIKLSRTLPVVRYCALMKLLRYRLRKFSHTYNIAGTKNTPKMRSANWTAL